MLPRGPAIAAAVLRRLLLLAGWALVVYVVWIGVPFVALYALGRFEAVSTATRGDLVRRALELVGFIFVAGFPALLAWFLLLLSGGRAHAAAVLASLISLAYAATAPEAPPAGRPVGDLAETLFGLRGAAYAFLSLVLSWVFAFALGSVLLRVEPAAATPEEALTA